MKRRGLYGDSDNIMSAPRVCAGLGRKVSGHIKHTGKRQADHDGHPADHSPCARGDFVMDGCGEFEL